MAALVFEHVFKDFPRHTGQLLIRDRLAHVFRRSRERFHALRDVSFSLEHGESMGVIGRNGAGKSTLLNIATGLCRPTSGKIRVGGRIAPMLELASGFHPDLTGAENIQINAALLGLTRKQCRQRFDPIVEFSGIGDFLYEPLRTYSAGMMMRLAFSVAVHMDPDVLIIDEVIGVGDGDFFKKCQAKVLEFREAGKTILCVSHSVETLLLLCDRGLWLERGQVEFEGSMREVVLAYHESAAPKVQAVG
jgi:lipopolysaccharide transport system ATP-binding protein